MVSNAGRLNRRLIYDMPDYDITHYVSHYNIGSDLHSYWSHHCVRHRHPSQNYICNNEYLNKYTIKVTICKCASTPSLSGRRWHWSLSAWSPWTSWSSSPFREITKSSSTFSATKISINLVWFFPQHDNFVWNVIFGTKFSSIYLANGEKAFGFSTIIC